MATTQYIGARYVPIFADPAEWNSTRTYEPLTIAVHEGNSYTSKQYVPTGIDITDDDFWVLTGNYNAQVEQYRKEVASFDGRITDNATAISAETTRATKAEQTNATAISAETTRATKAEQTNATAISAETTRATKAEQTNATAISNTDAKVDLLYPYQEIVVIGDSWSANATYTQWWKILESKFGFKVHCYAAGGAGYIAGKTFIDLINTGANDTSYNHENIKMVIMLGGCNDYIIDSSPLTAMQNCIARAKEIWPNAQPVLINNGWPFGKLDKLGDGDVAKRLAAVDLTRSAFRSLALQGVVTVCADWILQLAQKGFYDMDDASSYHYHPLQAGMNYLAAFIAASLFGGNAPSYSTQIYASPEMGDNLSIMAYVSSINQNKNGVHIVCSKARMLNGVYYSPYPMRTMTVGSAYNIGASFSPLVAIPNNDYSIQVVNFEGEGSAKSRVEITTLV